MAIEVFITDKKKNKKKKKKKNKKKKKKIRDQASKKAQAQQ